jgi:argininosuccinate lyase
MMPQKKNPDVLELIRGKTGRVYGALITVLTVLKGLPLSYNRDLQEDKEPLFNVIDTLQGVLPLMAALVNGVRFNEKRMVEATEEGHLIATDMADYLAQKGLPFREAHGVVGQMVQRAIATRRPFSQWTLAELQQYSPRFTEEMLAQRSVAASVAKRSTIGGTSVASVKKAIQKIKTERG